MTIPNYPACARAEFQARYGDVSPELVGYYQTDERRRATPKERSL
jgi:hypothetical protein